MAITLYEPITYSDTGGDLSGRAHAAGQDVSFHLSNLADTQTLVGDCGRLLGRAAGGHDTLTSFAYAGAIVIGDAIAIVDRARGGNDTILASSSVGAIALGDAVTLGGRAQAGNDSIDVRGGLAAAYGDAFEMTDRAKGGNDIVTGAASLFTITELYGDAQTLNGRALGGNDTIVAIVAGNAPVTSVMYGDAIELLGRSAGGNDRLISASDGNEQMWGDAAVVARSANTGADTFEFSPLNGQDTIMDFQRGQDHIVLNGFGFTEFDDIAGNVQYTSEGALIALGAGNSILVLGIDQLNARDFILS